MISMARIFGAPERVPAGKVARNTSKSVAPGEQFAADVGDDVHDMGVALDDHQLVDL